MNAPLNHTVFLTEYIILVTDKNKILCIIFFFFLEFTGKYYQFNQFKGYTSKKVL